VTMTKIEKAQAFPRKQFFLEMFTRDISLEDCTLDLIDNSVDSYLRKNNVNISDLVFGKTNGRKLGGVTVTCSDHEIRVMDNCGGIDYEDAKNFVFCFGHAAGERLGKLGAYGIGLKRAIFKMGNIIRISSKTQANGFEADLDVSEWSKAEDDWTIPIKKTSAASSTDREGTDIRISSLHPEVKMRINDGSLLRSLYEDVAQTYAFFIGKCVRVTLNGESVEPEPIPIGQSEEVKPARESFTENNVKVTLVAAIAPPGKQRTTEKAGWYILCNGRVVVSADKTDLTGWGIGVPAFHNKYTRFIGIALFESKDPLKLPWTTTKRDVNRESMVFQRAKNVMAGMTKPITTFLNSLYPQDPQERLEYRDMLKEIRGVDFASIASRKSSAFEVKTPIVPKPKTDAHVVYNVPVEAVERVRRCIGKPRYSDSQIGKFTFNHFLENECSD
jgi:hypothetical protein